MRIYALEHEQDPSLGISVTLQRTLKPHTTPVITTTVDVTSTLVATGGADGVIKVWDIRGGYVTHTFRGHAGVITALRFFTTEGAESISDKKKKKARRKSKSQDDVEMELEHVDDNMATSYLCLASGSEEGKIRIWGLVQRKAISTLESHVSVVRCLQYSPRVGALISASRDKTVILWDVPSWKVRRVIPVLEGVESAGFLNDGAFLYTGGESGRLRVWSTENAREVTEEQDAGSEGDSIVHVLYNRTHGLLLSIHTDQTLNLHSISLLSDITNQDTIPQLPILRRISGTHDEIIDLGYVMPDRSLLALATNSEDLRIVSLATAESQSSSILNANYFGADVTLLQGHEDIIICLSVDWSGHWLATGAKDNVARLWRIDHANSSYTCHAIFTGHAESLGAICLPSQPPPTNSTAYTNPLDHPPAFLLTGSQDRTIKRWEISRTPSTTARPRALYTGKAHDKDINALAISPTTSLFATASQDRTVKIWSLEDGEIVGILRGHRRGVWSVAFAPRETPSISSDNGPASASGGLILTGSGDKTLKIWNLGDYTCLRTFEGHTNSVLKVLWMPAAPPPSTTNKSDNVDDTRPTASRTRVAQIASAGGDGLVKVWDANTGEVACTLDNHTDRIWALIVNPVTNMLVSGGGDSTVTFWADTSAATISATAATTTRRVEEEQMLMNSVHRGDYREAITLALQLNHPARLLAILTTVIDSQTPEPDSLTGVKAVDKVLSELGDEQLLMLLKRVRDWNTNARTAGVAQRVLNLVVRRYTPDRLAGIRGVGEVLGALRAYTERHYRRVEELVDESFLVEYTLREMEEVGGAGEAIVV